MEFPPKPERFSDLHLSVSSALTALGLPHSHEVDLGGLTVDIQLADGRVIEVDGKHHFDRKRQYTGHTLFKHRLLRGMGYEVFSINCFEWGQLSTGQQLELLRTLLSSSQPKRIPAE